MMSYNRKVSLLTTLLYCCLLTIQYQYSNGQEEGTTSTNNNNNEICQTVYTDIVIVGAGFTGIFAAGELQDLASNLNVIVLEATDHIGGRVKKSTIPNTNVTIELGANWLHNYGSALQKLASELNVITAPTNFNDIYAYNEKGKSIQRLFNARRKRFFNENQPLYKTMQITDIVNADDDNTAGSTEYDGSESVNEVLYDNNYKEQSEIDTYLKWWTIDYTYTHPDVAITDFLSTEDGGSTSNEGDDEIEYDTLVRDPRGYATIIEQYATNKNIVPIVNSKVTDIIYDGNFTTLINDTYKVLVRTVDTKTNTNCINYYAQRTIVTVPVSILRGNGYNINFQPSIQLNNLPYWTGQFNKVFFKFKTNFWSSTTAKNNHEFIAILRNSTYRYLCNHWMDLNIPIPNSNTLLCIISSVGMKKYIAMNLTEIDLLEPLKVVFGADVVTAAYENVIMSRWDLDPASGYGAYSNFRSGYTSDQAKLFWGGYDNYNDVDELIQGEGYNNQNEWIVHLSGAASCEAYNEQTDGAYYAGKRSARHILRSILGNDEIDLLYDCDYGESSE